jgi:ketosteroid isomerase-like protein
MAKICVLFVVAAAALFSAGYETSKTTRAQQPNQAIDNNSELEKVLWEADQKWLCNFPSAPNHMTSNDCVEFRRKYWPDQFFEISYKGQVRTKAEMLAAQSAANYIPSPPYPDDFKLMAVYGNFALATDHTVLKTVDVSGKQTATDTRVLRMFVKENGQWRPAGAAQVPIASP